MGIITLKRSLFLEVMTFQETISTFSSSYYSYSYYFPPTLTPSPTCYSSPPTS
jgi:hypothetical protein